MSEAGERTRAKARRARRRAIEGRRLPTRHIDGGSKEAPGEHGGRIQLTLLVRAWCHLCDELHAALAPLARRHGAKVVVVDVDDHPALEAAHGERVPVLFLGSPAEGVELCHYHLDAKRVGAALAEAARASKTC